MSIFRKQVSTPDASAERCPMCGEPMTGGECEGFECFTFTCSGLPYRAADDFHRFHCGQPGWVCSHYPADSAPMSEAERKGVPTRPGVAR